MEEKKFSYKGLTINEIIHHLAYFVSRLWQIHIFSEGNTRTTAVFFIKYLRALGYDAINDIFAENAWYFRNALVRANYTNLKEGIHETTEYLELFIRNLLLNEKNELKNRHLHINSQIQHKNGAIDNENGAIDDKNGAIDKQILYIGFNIQTRNNVKRLYEKFGTETVFGRTDVAEICDLSYSASGKLIAKMKEKSLIEDVKGHGKEKYCFKL